mmetsp:Transcript_60305/g.191575  ORF Transcript_60305/g.191575 Transcript_60305/m.191575 type:complete len:255 (+) Transcript_60305:892-1656(+)
MLHLWRQRDTHGERPCQGGGRNQHAPPVHPPAQGGGAPGVGVQGAGLHRGDEIPELRRRGRRGLLRPARRELAHIQAAARGGGRVPLHRLVAWNGGRRARAHGTAGRARGRCVVLLRPRGAAGEGAVVWRTLLGGENPGGDPGPVGVVGDRPASGIPPPEQFYPRGLLAQVGGPRAAPAPSRVAGGRPDPPCGGGGVRGPEGVAQARPRLQHPARRGLLPDMLPGHLGERLRRERDPFVPQASGGRAQRDHVPC